MSLNEKVSSFRRGKLDLHHVRPLPHRWCWANNRPLKLTSSSILYRQAKRSEESVRQPGSWVSSTSVARNRYRWRQEVHLWFLWRLSCRSWCQNIEVKAARMQLSQLSSIWTALVLIQTYPTKKVTLKDANNIKAGSLKESNDRVIHQLIIDGVAGVRTCQLQMGVTELKEGSVVEHHASSYSPPPYGDSPLL